MYVLYIQKQICQYIKTTYTHRYQEIFSKNITLGIFLTQKSPQTPLFCSYFNDSLSAEKYYRIWYTVSMIITYHGKQFFKLQQGDFTLAYNPISKDSKINTKPAKFGSNITLVSVRHEDYNGIENTTFGDTEPFIIQGPGSYEVDGVTINGFGTKALIDDVAYINTVYFVVIEDITYCFIGDLENIDLDQDIKEFTDSVDVLFVPIGSNGTISPAQATKVTKLFSPKVIIPMDYGPERDKGVLDTFVKEMGASKDPVDKYVFKKSDIESLTGKVVVIKEQ